MDGNRTWAQREGLPQLEGHRRGYNNVEHILNACLDRGIKYVSFWALSDDNIKKRSSLEVKYLFDLLTEGIGKLVEQSNAKNVRLHFVGDRSLLRADCREALERAEISTADNTGMQAIFAIGYGGQEEIARAVRMLAQSGKNLETVTSEDIHSVIDTGKFPPPDMIVRTGGHMRHSGFFLFQSPYAEYFFSEKNWPEFDVDELDRVLVSFTERTRKFGA